ncbi:Hint domain-containing protein [Planktotalea sp.]|uniref:Hint domain-containing protein n=1 Tax=Planktotalea sp. TaxID=2029877 RepID=UPI00329718C2
MLDWTKSIRQTAQVKTELVSEATGILVGTRVATNVGWRDVEALCLGDSVLTFDHGFRAIVGMRRVTLWDGNGECPEALRPLRIETGFVENTRPVSLLPMQGVMVESEAAEDHRGDPFAVLMPSAIESYGLAGTSAPVEPIQVIILEFEDDEVIYGESGVLYFVPRAFDLLTEEHVGPEYKVLDAKETYDVLEELYSKFYSF